MAKKVKDFYLGPTPLEPSTPEGLVNAISDSSYAHPVDTAAKVLISSWPPMARNDQILTRCTPLRALRLCSSTTLATEVSADQYLMMAMAQFDPYLMTFIYNHDDQESTARLM